MQTVNIYSLWGLPQLASFGSTASPAAREQRGRTMEPSRGDMFNKHKSKIIILSAIILLTAATIGYVRYLLNQPLNIPLPQEFTYQNTIIPLSWTDDNTGETLIIQTDKKIYTGFNQAQVYFSITNISRQDRDMDIVIWFEDGERKVEKVERLNIDESMNSAPLVIQNLIQDPGVSGTNENSDKQLSVAKTVNDNSGIRLAKRPRIRLSQGLPIII